MEILCFFAGIAFFYKKSLYPLYFIGTILLFWPKRTLLLWFLAAIGWCLFHQWLNADQGMPHTHLIHKATLQGYVSSIPTRSPGRTQFQLSADHLDGHIVDATVLVSCYDHCPDIRAGQYWQFEAKLKKPINLANPGGFDYVGWLSSRHIQWVGTIYKNTFKQLAPQSKQYPLIELREHLARILAELIPDEENLGIFEALTLGLTTHIDKAQWDLFRRTGTTHLIDISGEHVALIAGLTYWLIKWLWRFTGHLSLRCPAPRIASTSAIIVSLAYGLIAGFAVPTQRSLFTCSLIMLRHFRSQKLSVWQSWRYALLVVLLIEPHSVFMIGFYFSFIAVAILIIIHQRIKQKGIPKVLSMQLACMLGLMPLSLYWFSYGSINGLIANLIAIPLVGFIIVPLALFIAFLSPWVVIPGSVFILKWSIQCLLFCLRIIDSVAIFNFNFTFTHAFSPLVIMAAMGVFLCLPLVRLFPAASLLIVSSLFPHYEKIRMNEAKMDVLDVGQGLAVIVRTAHHVLLYDTGMKFYQSNDMGKLAIIPYLSTLGIKHLDKVVISHPDLDHRGGLESLSEKYMIDALIVDDPAFYKKGFSCHHYQAWHWDGVTFRFFPIAQPLRGKNNHSCILQISNPAGKILLSGDIEKRAEDYLIRTYGKELASNIMLIPHHGSKTSSSQAYVNQVAPQYAIASYGFDNRYHFPHKKGLEAYRKRHIPVYNTVDCGMVSVSLKKGYLMPQCYR